MYKLYCDICGKEIDIKKPRLDISAYSEKPTKKDRYGHHDIQWNCCPDCYKDVVKHLKEFKS